MKKVFCGHIGQCQICSHRRLTTVLSLGHEPPVHGHITKEKLNTPEITYPLNFCRCGTCGLLQLDYAVDPKILFSEDYPYLTGMTNMLVKNFRALANSLVADYKLTAGDLVVDIGANDGTLLQGFKEKGIQVLGVEPTDAALTAQKRGIPMIRNFFTKGTADYILKKFGPAKIITATNMFAHVNNPFEFLSGIKKLLTEEGVFVSESQYLMDILEKLEIDTIYHEHLRYYSLKPMQKLFDVNGFTLTDAERIDAAGGSIRVWAVKHKARISKRVKNLIQKEEAAGMYDRKTWENFAQKAISVKQDLIALLIVCKKEGAHIVGIGAPGRSNTLLNFFKIDSHLLDYAAERRGSPKIGLLTPGMHIPIFDEQKVLKEQPEYALLLSWHIGTELAKKLRTLGYKGKFIMPLPKPRILSNI